MRSDGAIPSQQIDQSYFILGKNRIIIIIKIIIKYMLAQLR